MNSIRSAGHVVALFFLFLMVKPVVAAAPCDEFVATLPNFKRALCESASLQASTARSVSGRTIWMRDIKADKGAMRVLVVGAIHGDELSSASLALQWIQLAGQAPAGMQQAVHWRFIPVLNPEAQEVASQQM